MANPKLTKEELEKLNVMRSKSKNNTLKRKKSYDFMTIAVAKGVKDIWKEESKSEGKSLTQFIVDAVDFYIDNK